MKKKEERSKWFIPAVSLLIIYIIGIGFITGKLEWFLIALGIEGVIVAAIVVAMVMYDRKKVV